MDNGDLDLQIDGDIYKICDGLYRFGSVLYGLRDIKSNLPKK